ncbi:hypothetical protein G5V59_27435 [Nocardioides sp. W3-2-3]|uniref:LPD29 domain-containing protein n=1 Tax=Nocardioides convexus TaxID=2712224 RepID=UPI0024184D0E|nr:LPD29 domain-containing protein [Nocardioides convexus]NHA02116.1 hypothetical protein [Nocardioides convexus]
MEHQVKEFTTKETAAELRKALRAAYPGVRFSVRMARGSAHGWFDVNYVDGPPTEVVDQICHRFQSLDFDGRDDGYHPVEPTLYATEDGGLFEPRYSCCGVATRREYTPEVQEWAETIAVEGTRWWNDTEYPQKAEPVYYATRALLGGLDLTNGLPDHPERVWRSRWEWTKRGPVDRPAT